MDMDTEQEFIKDRNEAFLSLDRNKIEAFIKKWDCCDIPSNERVFWAGVHKARLSIVSMPKRAKEISRKWLVEHGFSRISPRVSLLKGEKQCHLK
jgi:hypothetical protein